MLKTVKFGGTSMATAEQFRKVAAIIRADESRRYVVVSAPGKRSGDDIKVTDLLYACCAAAERGEDFSQILAQIRARFEDIRRELGLSLDLSGTFTEIENRLRTRPSRDYAASRGEYLSAMLMADYLGIPMVDAAGCVLFDEKGSFQPEITYRTLSARLKEIPRAVIPGFYGSFPDGSIHTFSRGGSDVTGAIVARATNSRLYENWTDVSGLLSCDPHVVENPAPIRNISYTELRELSYMGASVLHESAIFPVKSAGIPINIRNTNNPDHPGTMIHTGAGLHFFERPVTGIAGRKGFSTVLVEMDQMNETVGYARDVLDVFANHGILMEHMPSGIDTLSVVVPTEQLEPHRNEIIVEIKKKTHADAIYVSDRLSLIAVVGRGMVRQKGVAGRVFNALGKAEINVNMIDQGSSELNIIIGVDTADFEKAMRVLYKEFFSE